MGKKGLRATRISQEEELFTLAYGLPLEGEGDAKCLSSLHLVEESVMRQLKGSKGITSKKRIPEGLWSALNYIKLFPDFYFVWVS
jgi:hypothetical protein